jgi:4a-hydroxytetrahydrobiopterin dehydratase
MWQEINNQLYKKFIFKDFKSAMQFVQKSAVEMDKMDHHALWTNIYNEVEVRLSTHSAGDIVTEKDHKLAKAMDAFFAEINP